MLVRKVWEKRAGVLSTSSRFAQKLLLLTAEKLESGERLPLPVSSSSTLSSLDRPFPSPTEINNHHVLDEKTPQNLKDPTFIIGDKPVRTTPRVEISREKQRSGRKPLQLSSSSSSPTISSSSSSSTGVEPMVSSRLQNARQRLDQLEQDDY